MLISIVIVSQINDTILKAPYVDIEVQSFDARGVGALEDDCVQQVVAESRGDGFVYLVAYDNEGNSGDIVRFPYKGIMVQGFANPENTDQDLDCIYSFDISSSGDTVILEAIYDGTSRNTPDTAEIMRVIYRDIWMNGAGFPSPTGGYYAIRAFVAGINPGGYAFLRIDTTFNITPVDNPEVPGSGKDLLKETHFFLRVHVGMGGIVRFTMGVPSEGDVSLSVFDVAGRNIFSYRGRSDGPALLSLSRKLPSGIYVATFIWNGRKRSIRFVSF